MAIEKTFQTPGDLRVVVGLTAGDIEVESVDGEQTSVVVDADKPEALDHVLVELRERGSGHDLVIETERKRGLFGGLVQVQIGGLSIGQAAYRVRIRCPHSADLALRSVSADVETRGRFGRGEIKTTSGDVDLDELDGDLDVRTVSGDVRVRRVAGRLNAQTVSADLRIESAGSTVTTKTVSGDQRLGVEQGEVRTTSVSGDIEIAVRAGSRVDVDASTVSGDLRSELELSDVSTGDGPVVVLRGKTVSGDFRVLRGNGEPARAA